jgi:hypothetical protein
MRIRVHRLYLPDLNVRINLGRNDRGMTRVVFELLAILKHVGSCAVPEGVRIDGP